MREDQQDDPKDREIGEVIGEAKNPRRRRTSEKLKQKENVRKALQKGDRAFFMEALRRAGITDGTRKFLDAVEAFDRYHKRWRRNR